MRNDGKPHPTLLYIHGGFGVEAARKAYAEVFDFLGKAGITVKRD